MTTFGTQRPRLRAPGNQYDMNLILSRTTCGACLAAICLLFGLISPGAAHAQSTPGHGPANTQPPPAAAPVREPAAKLADGQTGLTDQILYQYLISEIAGQRGRTGLALRGLMDLAQKTRDPRLARRGVELAFQARDMAQALEATTLWLDLEPNSPVARQALSALGGSQDTVEAARMNIALLLAQSSKSAGGLMQVNALLARFPDKPVLVPVVRELVAPYMALPEAHYALASAHYAAKQLPAALAAIEEALQRREGWEQAAILKSQILRESSEAGAATYLAGFLEQHADAQDVRVAYARLLVSQKNYLQAREQFRIAAKGQPDDLEIQYAAGVLSQQIEDHADADAQFRLVLAMMPRDPNPVLFNLGSVAEARRRADEAIEWYGRIGTGEYFVSSRLKIAGIRAKRDGMAAGRKYLKEAQDAEREMPETKIQLILAEAQLLRDAKAHREAFNLLSDAIKEHPDTADLMYDRAMVAEKVSELDVMEADLRRVIELKPDYAHAYNALGYTFAERSKRLDEAYELVQKALKLSPNDAYIQDSLGWVQFRQGRLDDAYQTLKAAYELRRDPEIAAHLGEVMWVKGDRNAAVKLWKASLRENPDNEVLAAVIRKFSP